MSSFMQVPIATITSTGAKSFAPPLSPPLSPGSNDPTFKNAESSATFMNNNNNNKNENSKNENNSKNEESQKNKPNIIVKSKPKNKYRMRICDAPPELLELIKRSEEKKEKSLPEKSKLSNSVKNISSSSTTNKITLDEKRHRFRKNPYPKKAPSKSSPGITLQVDVYTTLKEDPGALLRRSEKSNNNSVCNSNSNSFISSSSSSSSSSASSSSSPSSSFIDNLSDVESPNSSFNSTISHRSSPKKQITKTKTKTKRTKPVISERKRKGNSLARVMADRGLLESTLTPIVVAGEIKPIRIPPPPPMQFDELMKNIEQLNLDLNILQRINPKINWKGQPLSISHLPHHNSLHHKEAHVASTLRLTPVQYLTAKHTLISSARRYAQKSLPFRKSDAQKLLRIDVNKASKLWEFFMQVKWI